MRWQYIFSGTTHHSLANYTGAPAALQSFTAVLTLQKNAGILHFSICHRQTKARRYGSRYT